MRASSNFGTSSTPESGSSRLRSRATSARSVAYASPTVPAATPATSPVRFSALAAIRLVDSVPASRPSGHASTASPSAGRSLADVGAGHPGADAGHDLVGDGAEPFAPLGGGDLVVALAADEDHLVVGLGRHVAEVDEQLVHG